MRQYIVICEGRSEYVYLERLQSFLDSQAESWDVPLKLFPKIARNPDGSEKGGGDYKNVITGYKDNRNRNKKSKIEVWVDYDIYLRNDRSNLSNYRSKTTGIPDFKFSFHNFEDFLVLHMANHLIENWHTLVEPTGHFVTPLHSKAYVPIFENIIPGYRKGDLSPDFISKESLLRLKQNIQTPIIRPTVDASFGNFAEFLIGQIDEAYPTLFF
jgi:hypothetical protein